MVQISSKGTPRNPVVRTYYEKRKAEGKTSQQALICVSRRLISIIYGMLKNAKNGNPISYEEAKILDEWAKEYNVPQHHPAEVGSGQHFPG